MIDIDKIIAAAPENFVIQDALIRCAEIIDSHNKIMCSVSGGADSDVMLDMIIRCGGKEKTAFAFFNTGIEYRATLDHLSCLEAKYGIEIERVQATQAIPTCVKRYGVPFLNKEVSGNIYYLQMHGFEWEDESYDSLIRKYPGCKVPLRWWCNCGRGDTQASSRFMIKRHSYLKEFLMSNPPEFMISNKCCHYAKKLPSKQYEKKHGFDLKCLGIRKAEGGVRSIQYKTCFTECAAIDQFRPVFWLRDSDMSEYCNHYGIEHSKCYSEYGFTRTGCSGCPFNLQIERDLESIQQYEPQMYKLSHAVFGQSYEYTRMYHQFREKMKGMKG